jgi:GMP synthase-like glutamine amidotransferase
MAIVMLQYDERGRSGRLGTTLRDHGFKLDVRRIFAGDEMPVDFDDVDGVVALPARANTSDGHAWIEKQRVFLREAHERALPVVGVCFGAQVLAEALGGSVSPMEVPEVGFTDVELTPPAHTDTILAGVAWKTPQFQTHRCEISEPPPGCTVLAKSERCAVQAFRAGMRTYGFQYHFECDRSMVDTYMRDARTDLHQSGVTTDEFARDVERKYEMFARLADRLCVNIATYLIPRVANAVRS